MLYIIAIGKQLCNVPPYGFAVSFQCLSIPHGSAVTLQCVFAPHIDLPSKILCADAAVPGSTRPPCMRSPKRSDECRLCT